VKLLRFGIIFFVDKLLFGKLRSATLALTRLSGKLLILQIKNAVMAAHCREDTDY